MGDAEESQDLLGRTYEYCIAQFAAEEGAGGEEFVLMTKQEVIDSRLFGNGKEHECFRGMLGDYLAVAIGDLSIYNTKEEAEHFIGVHAGLSKEEMEIPLIVSECGA